MRKPVVPSKAETGDRGLQKSYLLLPIWIFFILLTPMEVKHSPWLSAWR